MVGDNKWCDPGYILKEEQQHFLFAVCSYAKGDQNFITDIMYSKNLVISKFKFIVNIYQYLY